MSLKNSSIQQALDLDAADAARELLGWELIRELPGGGEARVRIVETEAYDQSDAASHSYRGKTPRTEVMFGPAGHLYVYFTYGMHYCCNVVVGPEGLGAAVLIRAVEPVAGEELLAKNRGGKSGADLTNGPAKLCQALAIDRRLNGHALNKMPLKLQMKKLLPGEKVVSATRIGISRDTHRRWRFYIAGNSYVSR